MGILSKLFGSREMKDNNQTVQEYNTHPIDNGSFYFIVDDVFTITGRGTVVTGVVDFGEVHVGDTVIINGSINTEVTGIEMFRKKIDFAKSGEACGILLKGISRDDIHKGDYLTK